MSQPLIYNLTKTSSHSYDFTTTKGIDYTIYLTSLSHLSHLFIGNDKISEKNFYYLIIDRKGDDKIIVSKDPYIKRTVMLCLFQFFIDNPQAVVLFNYSNGDNKIKRRRILFKRWFEEYSQDSIFKFYQHDFKDEASICALYKRYSAHINFVDVEDKIKEMILQISSVITKSNG